MPVSTFKDKYSEDQLLKNRLLAAMLAVLLLVGALVARLVYLQVISHEHFTTLSINNRVKIVPLPPTRGLIRDRNGVVLAQNQPSFSLEVVPEAVDDMDATLVGLAQIISLQEDDIDRFRRLLRSKRRFESIPLRFRLSEQEVARFAVNRYRFPGVDIEARLTRQYPLAATTSHVIGYVGRINETELKQLDEANYSGTSHVGKSGVEKAFESVLHGRVGYQQVETNAQGRVLRVLGTQLPAPGYDLTLYLDAQLQLAAEQALAGERGSVVALDPNTGGVLAMVSTPGFDPNLFVNGIDAASYKALRDSPDRPLFNRSLQGQYPPGSTIKPFVALAGIEYDVPLADGHTWCRGWFQLPGKAHRYRDWKKGGHGKVDLNWAIQRSCDVYFYEMALELGVDKLHAFLSRFGLGEASGIDIGGEASGLLPSRAWKRRRYNQPWYPGETLITGIGQGYNLVTPLQLAVATATIATRGRLMHPKVVEALDTATVAGEVPMNPVQKGQVTIHREDAWQRVIQAMQDVVHAPRGTAHKIAKGVQYTIAGKTGTAQVFGIGQEEEYEEADVAKRLRDHALFIAFAPVEAPAIAVAVVVENGGGGSHTAAPIARIVLDAYLNDKSPVSSQGIQQEMQDGT